MVPDMTQDAQAQRSAPRRKPWRLPPGIAPSLAMAVISGVVCWFWFASGRADSAKAVPPSMSELTDVAEKDIGDALTTMGQSNGLLARFRQAKDGTCRPPLTWVSLVSPPGEPPSQIRLISGSYYSPIIEVSAIPVRVAIPYPQPYETGRGELIAVDVGGSAIVALLPAWRVSAAEGKTTRTVVWHPMGRCSLGNG